MEVTHKIDPKDGVVLFVSVNGMRIAFTESEWSELQKAREAIMQPVWEARRKAQEAEYNETYRREHNIQERVEVIEGVKVIVTTQGPNNEVCNARVGDDEMPRIKATRVYRSGDPTSWNVEVLDATAVMQKWHRPYVTLRNKRGGAIAFKTPQAAIRAAIRQELLAEAL